MSYSSEEILNRKSARKQNRPTVTREISLNKINLLFSPMIIDPNKEKAMRLIKTQKILAVATLNPIIPKIFDFLEILVFIDDQLTSVSNLLTFVYYLIILDMLEKFYELVL